MLRGPLYIRPPPWLLVMFYPSDYSISRLLFFETRSDRRLYLRMQVFTSAVLCLTGRALSSPTDYWVSTTTLDMYHEVWFN